MQSSINQVKSQNCVLGCFGAVYIGTEITKEWIKGIPSIIKEVFNYFPAMGHCFTKKSQYVYQEIKETSSPLIQGVALTTNELGGVIVSGSKQTFKQAVQIKTSTTMLGKELAGVIKNDSKETCSYILDTLIAVKKKENDAVYQIKILKPLSSIKLNAVNITVESLDYFNAILKLPVRCYRSFPRKEINNALIENLLPALIEPLKYANEARDVFLKKGNSFLENTTKVTLILIEKFLFSISYEFLLFVQSMKTPFKKEFLKIILLIEDLRTEVFEGCINKTLFELAGISLMFGQKAARHVLTTCIKTLEIARMSTKGVFFISYEFLSYFPSIYNQSLKNLKRAGKYGICLKEFKVIFKCFSETIAYVNPSIQVINHTITSVCLGIEEVSIHFPPVLEELTDELMNYVSYGSIKSFNQIAHASKLIKHGSESSSLLLVELGKEFVLYARSGSTLMQKMAQAVKQNPEKKRIYEQIGRSVLEVRNYLKSASKSTNRNIHQLIVGNYSIVRVISPPAKTSIQIAKEELDYIKAGFNEVHKLGKLLEEDFPSSFQHFIVDPTHFWLLKKHRSYQEAKERFKVRMEQYKEWINEFKHRQQTKNIANAV